MDILLYGMPRPSRATRVAWALEEAGADWRHEAVDPRSDAYGAINPYRKVPALSIDGTVLTESAACCLWVADAFPEAELAPAAGTLARADHDRWVHFVISELEQPLWTKAKHTFALPEAHRVDGLKPTLGYEFEKAAGIIERRLGGGQHMVGDRFTIADLMVAHTGFWAMQARFELPPAFAAMTMAHGSRPALARANARSRPATSS
jgi:glutathione S-transferase